MNKIFIGTGNNRKRSKWTMNRLNATDFEFNRGDTKLDVGSASYIVDKCVFK